MRSFHLTLGMVCVRDWVSGLPKMMSWGLLLTPTPALVPAATSTWYCTPACSPPTTTERMVASTDLLMWKRLSLAKHQIWQRKPHQREFVVRLYSTLQIYAVCPSIRSRVSCYLVLLDDAILLVKGRRVPRHTNGCAVMAPYCQHRHLLWRSTWCWWQRLKEAEQTKQVQLLSMFTGKCCLFSLCVKNDLFHTVP